LKAKVVEDADVVTYVVVGDLGDEAVSGLEQFARSERLEAAGITAVGAFEHATVGWFDRAAKEYRRIQVDEQCELLSLIGDVAAGEEGPIVHMHVPHARGDRDRDACAVGQGDAPRNRDRAY